MGELGRLGGLGPYRIVEELTGTGRAEPRRCIGVNGDDPREAAVLEAAPDALAQDHGHRVRFEAEARKSARLTGPAALGWLRCGERPRPWTALSYVPAVPLPQALAVHGEPLPARTVLTLATGMARTLTFAHADGLAHAGISPSSVLLAEDGPRLLGFGAVRAASVEGHPRAGRPGVPELGLAPEAVDGAAPSPLGDVFALGKVLGYAATGRAHPQPEELPSALRPTVLWCTSEDPAARPQAATLLTRLLEWPPSADWLPGPVVVAVGDQRERVRLASEETAAARPSGAEPRACGAPGRPGSPRDGASPRDGGGEDRGEAHSGQGAAVTTGTPASRQWLLPGRRALLTAGVAGLAGAALGGLTAYAGGRSESGGEDHVPQPGMAPRPLWESRLPFAVRQKQMVRWRPLVGAGGAAVYASSRGLAGIDLGNGRERWRLEGVRPRGAPRLLGDDVLVVSGNTLTAVSAGGGEVRWSDGEFLKREQARFVSPLTAHDGVFWCLARRESGGGDGEFTVVGYDTQEREVRFRVPLPDLAFGGAQRPNDETLLLPVVENQFTAVSLRDGERLWTRRYPGVSWGADGPLARATSDGLLAVTAENRLHVFETRSGKREWSFEGTNSAPFGRAVHRSDTFYLLDGNATVYALDAASGRWHWQSDSQLNSGYGLRRPLVTLSESGETVLASTTATVDAYDAASGELLWHFVAASRNRKRRAFAGLANAHAPGKALVQNFGVIYALPVD